jgi:hypothetical protein
MYIYIYITSRLERHEYRTGNDLSWIEILFLYIYIYIYIIDRPIGMPTVWSSCNSVTSSTHWLYLEILWHTCDWKNLLWAARALGHVRLWIVCVCHCTKWRFFPGRVRFWTAYRTRTKAIEIDGTLSRSIYLYLYRYIYLYIYRYVSTLMILVLFCRLYFDIVASFHDGIDVSIVVCRVLSWVWTSSRYLIQMNPRYRYMTTFDFTRAHWHYWYFYGWRV